MANLLPNDTREFLGLGEGLPYNSFVTPPSFRPEGGMLTDKSASERKARFQASAEMLFKTDLSKLDDVGVSGLYQCVTEGMFGLKDTDGQIAFGKRASKNPRENLEMLRRFVKGDYTLIEDPEYTKWREMDEEGKFQYALEKETTSNKLKSHIKGERGASLAEQANAVASVGPKVMGPDAIIADFFTPKKEKERKEHVFHEAARRSNYDTLNDEEKAAYRADVIGDYEKKLSRRQTLATYLQFASNLSDKAAYYLAESFQKGAPDINVEMLDPEERDRVYSAFSLMRGDKKRGRILGIKTDFTDDTVANRFQMGLYGLQQSLVGLVTDTGDMMRDGAMWAYAKATMDDAERKAFFEGWDANVRAERAMEQPLPEASSGWGDAFQGLMENVHWFIPYGVIGKGGKMMSAANKTVSRAKLQKEVFTGAKALAEMNAAAAKTRWLSDVQGAVKAGKGAKKVNEFQSALAMRRELAAVERYTKALEAIPGIQKAAKVRDAAGASMWAIGEASALSAFASEYVAAADAAGVSREESMITAWAIGLVNARIERLYVSGLESSLTASQVKALTFKALHNAVKSDGAAGFRKWFVNRVQRGVVEGAKITATEGLIEEPLQQLATEHGIEFNKLCAEMRKNGETDLADKAEALWQSFAKQLPEDYGVFIDTVVDSLPTSLAFGATGVGNMTRRQHLHNVITRHINRRAGSTSTMLTARNGQELMSAVDYDAGVIDIIQQAVNTRAAVENYWKGDESDEAKNPHRFAEALTAARRAYRDPQTRDIVQEVAEAAGVDVKTAEVITQYLQTEAEAIAFSPQARAFSSLRMSLADIDETTIKTVLPGYIEGSYAADEENGIYSGRVKLGDGTERTIAYRIGDWSEDLIKDAESNAKIDSAFGKSFNARHREAGDGIEWESLSDAQRYAAALQGALTVNGFSSSRNGVFELTDANGEKVRVNADDVIYLANGRFGDIGYGSAATMGTVRHETFHSLWRFARGTLDESDVQTLAKALGIDVTKEGYIDDLDEAMAHQLEKYASGHYVSHAVSSRFDKMLDGWAGKVIKFFGSFGPADEVRDPKTGKSFALKNFYDAVLRGELGSGKLGVEIRNIPAAPAVQSGATDVKAGTMPVEVTDEERAAHDAEMREEAAESEESGVRSQESGVGTNPSINNSAENPADASVPNQRYYIIGLPNSDIKLVGRLEVRDAHTGLTTSTDEDYHDRGNQNRDDKSEESRALVNKIAAHPDPLQIGTVQPIANNGIVWALPNGDVIIGNHRVNGVRAGYEKGTADDLEKFVREDAAKRGIEIGEGVKAPLTVFILERIEAPEGVKADEHEVVRLANESQNRGFNIREQAGNDAKILIDNNLLPRMAFRADGRLDETKCADAIGRFRQESGAQGLVGEDGMLTEEGQTRIQNAAVAALLAGTGNNALLGRIMEKAGRLDMASQLRALMKVTPELMALAKTKPEFDIRDALAEALTLYTEWREKDEEKRSEKGKSRHDWRELDKEGKRKRGLSWEAFMSQGDMFRTPSEEAKILGDLFAKTEQLRSFDREDVESAAGKKRVVDLITDYLNDYIENARNVNTETEDMFGSAPASRAEVLAAQRAKGESGVRFSMSAPVERSKNLIAIHNLKPSDLAAAAELEGMPAPSIAVVKDSMGHDNYGPISFVFGAGVIDPKADRNNKIYSSDAWTPTRGSVNIEYKVLDEKLDEIIASLINAGDENYKKLFKAFSERGSLGDTAENAIAAGEYYRLYHNDAILLSYLNSKGQSVPLSFREQAISHNYSNAVVKGVSDAVGDKIAEIWENGGKTGDEEAVERMSEIMRPAAVKAKDDENPEGAAERRAKGVPTLGERLYGAALKRPWDLAKAVMQYREHGITQEIDTFTVSKTMNELLSTDDPAYQEWVRSTFAPAVGAKGIRNKRELFTPSGSRRSWEALHDEVTAQRIVDMMYHNSKEVGGNGFGGYNPEGAAVRTYASITEMRRDRDRLKVMPEEEWKKLHDEARKDMIDAVSRLQSKQKGFYSDNSFIELDTIKDIVLQAWIDAKSDKAKYLSICKDELHVYDEETCGDIWDVMMRLRNAPTKYFEAKPERVVGFDEVAFAVVPDDSSAETLEILKTHAIQTHTYKAEDKEDRLRVLNKAADENDTRFSIAPGADLESQENFHVFKSVMSIEQPMPNGVELLPEDVSPAEALRFYEENILGRTINMPDGEKLTLDIGHFFRLVCDGSHGRKGFVVGFDSSKAALDAIRRNEVSPETINGYQSDRARMLPVFIDTVEHPVFEMQEKDEPNKTQFVKRYDAEGGRGVVAAFRFIKDGKKIQSFHGFSTRYGKVKKYRITYVDDAVIRGASPDAPELINQQAIDNISYFLPENNGPSAELLEAMAANASEKRKTEEKNKDKRKYSVAAEPSPLFKSVAQMSDDELVTAAVAVRMALGKSDKLSDRTVKINTVQQIMRRLHPEYKFGDVGRESMRVISDARKFAKKIREDIDRGVSDSLILEHLPQTAREQFGREMVEEARRGQRLGRFGQKVASKLEDRQARIVEDAVRVQTGMDVSLMENLYGINLSETLMHLAENPLTEKPPMSVGAGEGESVQAEESAGEEAEPIDVSAAVQAAVNEIVGAAKTATDANERNREDRRAAAGRDAERAAELDGEDATGGGAGEDFGGEDIVAIATKKAKLDLENPRHLAEFVAELTRRYWIKEHELGQNAEVWRDLVAVQFLRKTAQGIYAKLCKDLTYSRSRETAMQHIAKLDNVPTVQGLLSEMEFVGALINAQRIRDTQKALCEKLDFFLRQKFGAQGRFKPDKEEGKRNVSAEAELRARYMRHAMWLTPDAAADEARELQEKLDLLAVEFSDAGRDRDQSREFVETIRKLNVLREFGALRYKSVGEIEAAAKWWEDFERGESEDIVREMSDRDIRTKKAAELLAKAFADPKRVTVREGATTADRINKFLTGHMGFVALLNDCMRHATDADRAAVKDIVGYIQREIQKAGDGTATEKRHHNDAFHAAVESIYAKSFNKVMKEMMAEDERFLKFMGEVGGKRDIPTKGRAMQLLVSLLQEGRKVEVEDEENPGKTKFVYEGGYHDNIVKHKREGQAAELMKLMSPADMNMIKWLGMWYEQNRQDLSRVCHSLFGIGVYAELPNYFPVKMRLDKQGLEKGAAVGWTIFPKALTPRVKNERDFDTSADIFQMWSSRMEEGAQWKHHAQLGLEMRGIFGRAELQGAVISNHGEATNALMQGFITDVLAGKGAVDRSTGDVQYISDKIRGWTALCALGGNVGVMFKQMTSIPAFGFEIGLVDTARHIVSAFTPEGLAAMGKIWQSEQRKTRWDVGNSEAVANALNKQDAGWLKRAFQASMITNKLGDVVPALVVGQGVYRDCIARGMSEADAMAETWMLVERTQQSSRMENLASVQRRNRVGRIMFQFLSTQRQYLDYELRAIREVIAQPSSVNRWKKLGTTILLNHFILTSAYYWMGQLYKAMLGQEPPEDELTDWVITCLLGPYGSLFVAGFCCNYTLQRALKGYSYGGGSSMLPMESWLKNQVNDGAKLVEAIFDSEGDTWDNMLDAAGKWMSDSNSLFRDLRKIYRFRIKGEEQKKRK